VGRMAGTSTGVCLTDGSGCASYLTFRVGPSGGTRPPGVRLRLAGWIARQYTSYCQGRRDRGLGYGADRRSGPRLDISGRHVASTGLRTLTASRWRLTGVSVTLVASTRGRPDSRCPPATITGHAAGNTGYDNHRAGGWRGRQTAILTIGRRSGEVRERVRAITNHTLGIREGRSAGNGDRWQIAICRRPTA